MNILVLSTPFHSGFRAVFLDRKGQRKYFNEVFDDVRSVFSHSEVEILFKLHPRESNIYKFATDTRIRLFHNESDLYELVVLSDLYIAHPLTAANFIVRASKTPALFINLTPLEYMDEGRSIYGLRFIAKTHEEFRNRLREFKDGKLPLQYDPNVDMHSLEKIVAFIAGATDVGRSTPR